MVCEYVHHIDLTGLIGRILLGDSTNKRETFKSQRQPKNHHVFPELQEYPVERLEPVIKEWMDSIDKNSWVRSDGGPATGTPKIKKDAETEESQSAKQLKLDEQQAKQEQLEADKDDMKWFDFMHEIETAKNVWKDSKRSRPNFETTSLYCQALENANMVDHDIPCYRADPNHDIHAEFREAGWKKLAGESIHRGFKRVIVLPGRVALLTGIRWVQSLEHANVARWLSPDVVLCSTMRVMVWRLYLNLVVCYSALFLPYLKILVVVDFGGCRYCVYIAKEPTSSQITTRIETLGFLGCIRRLDIIELGISVQQY